MEEQQAAAQPPRGGQALFACEARQRRRATAAAQPSGTAPLCEMQPLRARTHNAHLRRTSGQAGGQRQHKQHAEPRRATLPHEMAPGGATAASSCSAAPRSRVSISAQRARPERAQRPPCLCCGTRRGVLRRDVGAARRAAGCLCAPADTPTRRPSVALPAPDADAGPPASLHRCSSTAADPHLRQSSRRAS